MTPKWTITCTADIRAKIAPTMTSVRSRQFMDLIYRYLPSQIANTNKEILKL